LTVVTHARVTTKSADVIDAVLYILIHSWHVQKVDSPNRLTIGLLA